jgi:hypothetical protein
VEEKVTRGSEEQLSVSAPANARRRSRQPYASVMPGEQRSPRSARLTRKASRIQLFLVLSYCNVLNADNTQNPDGLFYGCNDLSDEEKLNILSSA